MNVYTNVTGDLTYVSGFSRGTWRSGYDLFRKKSLSDSEVLLGREVGSEVIRRGGK